MKARRVELPEEVRILDFLPAADYSYACQIAVPTSDERSAEQWARGVFEGTPIGLRWLLVAGWRVGLGLRLGSRTSASYVLGWKVYSASPTMVVLGVESFALTARVVVHVVPRHNIVHATLLRYRRPVGRIMWAVARPIHEQLVPYLLDHAADRNGRDRGPE